MGFELRSVRQIDDAGGDIIDGGISVVAGGRGRTAERRRERKQRPPSRAAVFSRRGCARNRGSARNRPVRDAACGRYGGDRRRGRLPEPEQLLEDAAVVDRSRRGSRRHIRLDRMAGWRGKRAELRRTRRRQRRFADFGPLVRRRQGHALGLRGRRNGRKRLEARQRDRRVGSGRSSFEARHLRRSVPLQFGEQIGVDDNVGERLGRDRRRRMGQSGSVGHGSGRLA